MTDRLPVLLSDSELVLLNNALGWHLLALDPESPTFDRDVDEALALKWRIDSAHDARHPEMLAS